MRLSELKECEKNIIFECLNAAAFGPFFPEIGEFHEIYGIKQTDIENIISEWTDIDDCDENVKTAINTYLHLLSQKFSHYDEIWDEFISVPQHFVEEIYYKFNLKISAFSENEKLIVYECLKAFVSDYFIPDDLFQTLTGYERSDFEKIIFAWPDINENSKNVKDIIYQVLFQLTSFPNGFYKNVSEDIWQSYISVSVETVVDIFYKYSGTKKLNRKKWNGIINGTFTQNAKKLWSKFKVETQIKLLTNVWCPNCNRKTIISSYEGGS